LYQKLNFTIQNVIGRSLSEIIVSLH